MQNVSSVEAFGIYLSPCMLEREETSNPARVQNIYDRTVLSPRTVLPPRVVIAYQFTI